MTEEQVKAWVREEVRRIIDTGLFYTAEVDKEASQQKPQAQKPADDPKPKEVYLSPKLDDLLTYERDSKGVMWAKPRRFLEPALFREVCGEIEDLKGKWVKEKRGFELP